MADWACKIFNQTEEMPTSQRVHHVKAIFATLSDVCFSYDRDG